MNAQGPAKLWEMLAPDDALGPAEQVRLRRRAMWVTRSYDLVLSDPALLQYFTGVLLAADPRYRRTVLADPYSLTRMELEDHVGKTIDVLLSRPGADIQDLTTYLQAKHARFNIRPEAHFSTLAHFLTGGEQVGVVLPVLQGFAVAWMNASPLIVRKWAVK